MKVKELINELEKYNKNKDVVIKFMLNKYDGIGYTIKPVFTQSADEFIIIYGD